MDTSQLSVLMEGEIYGGALHSFTVWGSNDYDLEADRASWRALTEFLDERLGGRVDG